MFLSSARRGLTFRSDYGPWAVVTGASSGIGQAIATEVAAAGVHLVIVARTGAALEAVAEKLRADHAIDVLVVRCDLGTAEGVVEVERATERLDVGLFVAAAGFGTSGRFMDADRDTEMAMLDVNCRAVLLLSLHFARRFAERGRGGIVLFGSVVGFQGAPWAAHYAATKAYVQTLAEGLSLELKPQGVDVLSSAPGPVRSGFADRAGMSMGAVLEPSAVASATLRALGRRSSVAPGRLSKTLTWSLAPLPRRWRSRIMGRVMERMAVLPAARETLND
ncbi:SDR family NAD(P)-dependent oxidoreductase [Pengzhenrongella phosphoraccumulans]|uniref:SDR family NAD(P)-dependent oxidoreductase n=1 Tax=Pengzhenrongella phosphoraccumulans TaxID=3114394 RepID=UPI0038910E98